MSGWTQEPWELDAVQGSRKIKTVYASNDLWPATASTRENAERIVACVNALAGVEDPEAWKCDVLEVDRLREQAQRDLERKAELRTKWESEHARAESQAAAIRELREALREAAEGWPTPNRYSDLVARTAPPEEASEQAEADEEIQALMDRDKGDS